MMTQYTPFIVLVAVLVINTLSHSSAENVYCITPTATSCSSCPHNTHCTTLSEYAQAAELYFTSNTTMVFLPGDHVLDTNITVVNVTRLTLCGESSSGNRATVVCSGSVGLSFTSMVEFKIDFLSFTSCNRKLYGTYHIGNYALLLHSTQSAELVNCSFHDNLGTALVVNNTNITLSGNSQFIHNCWYEGGGIVAVSSNLTFTGNTTFRDNSVFWHGPYICCHIPGGAISAFHNTVLSFSGNNSFINNSAGDGSGGAIYASSNTVLSFNGNNSFINNSAYQDGGAIFTWDNSELSFSGTNSFINNSAHGDGGAIFTWDNTTLSFNGSNSFINNSAYQGSGAIRTHDYTVLSFSGISNFINNSVYHTGGAIFTYNSAALSFNGTNNFINNSANNVAGGAIYVHQYSALTLSGNSNFHNNSAAVGGAIYTSSVLHLSGTSNFINNHAVHGGAIYAEYNSRLAFSGTIHLTNNGGKIDTLSEYNTNGGGVYMGIQSTFSILPNTSVYWKNNHAMLGGAIYVRDASPMSYCTTAAALVPKEDCFFQLPDQNLSNGIDVKLIFKNNSAAVAGSVLYGGTIDNCKLTHGLDSHSSGEVFDMIVHNKDSDYNTTSNISSDPFYMCSCKNNYPDCSMTETWYGSRYDFPRTVYPGETIQFSVVAIGQRNGKLPSTVRSTISSKNSGFETANVKPAGANFRDSQYLQQASNTCTKLNYTVFSLHQNVFIKLQAEGSPCSKSLHTVIAVKLNQICPPGFNISKPQKSCVCEPRLAKYTHQCNITHGIGQITRNSYQHFWVGYENTSDELILHPHCPFDYCVNDTVVFSLNNTDIQCANNRSGFLCGRCRESYSLVLGTQQCRKCTNSHLVLLIPFAVMGITLVLLLLVCKLTVVTGTLSGLMLYANIVGVNRTNFLAVNPILSVFIAWLNLDFGIETCFYNGMDAYSKTWLQFVFPVYIWVLVGLIILVSHFSHRFARLLGNNPVSVLATLILLSYTKMLRTLITAIHITYLEYPTYNKMVWLYDANIDYLSGKHIPLFLVAVLIFLFLFLPYTLLLLFGQWLQTISHLRLFSWVDSARLKAFMDSYHAPYKAKHRYWPGLLLVLRFSLLLVSAFNFQEDPKTSLLAILIGAGNLFLWLWIIGGVYTNKYVNILEGSFVLNLIILTVVTYCVDLFKGNHRIVEYTCTISVSIALATFIGILAFQLASVSGITQCLKRKCAAVPIRSLQADVYVEPLVDDFLPDRLINPEKYEPLSYTPQGHASSEPTEGANEVQKRLITPVYTYGSIN